MSVAVAGVALAALAGKLAWDARKASQLAAQEQKKAEQKRKEEEWVKRKTKEVEAHIPDVKDGGVLCSCERFLGASLHEHALHVEAYTAHAKPQCASGWPVRHFTTVPYADLVQRGVISKGDLDGALFLAVQLTENADHAQVRRALARVPALIADIEHARGMRIVGAVAVSPDLWSVWDAEPPTELKNFPARNGVFPAQADDVDIFLFAKGFTTDTCYELSKNFLTQIGFENVKKYDRRLGFRHKPIPMAAHDLTGFIDGTRNPDHLLRAIVDQVVIFPDDNETADISHAGGSYLYAGRFEHDLQKFYKMSDQEKSHLVGRDYSRVEPHVGYDTRPINPPLDPAPPNSHVARAHGAMHRHAYPYCDGGVEGLYFVSCARSLKDMDVAINRMSGAEHSEKIPDSLLSITKAMTSGYYYVPSLRELQQLPDLFDKRNTTKSEKSKNLLESNSNSELKSVKIFIEYCTNCGYKTIYNDKKRLLESVSPLVEVIGNPQLPRQSAFEITTHDGVVLWSKLAQPDGRNNFPHCFPKNENLEVALNQYLKQEQSARQLNTMKIYTEMGTRVGVW